MNSQSQPKPLRRASADVLSEELQVDVAGGSTDLDRRMVIKVLPAPVLGSLRWPSRPVFPDGNVAWTFMVESGSTRFAVVVGQVGTEKPQPFEVWVLGAEAERGLGAVAKTLSMDMRSQDRRFLATKLASLQGVVSGNPLAFQLGDDEVVASSGVAALAKVVAFRMGRLDAGHKVGDRTPLMDALLSQEEPESGPRGTLSWTVDFANPNTGDALSVFLKEAELPDGSRRPYSVWLSGTYPGELDGLCKLLSIDMRVIDPAWIGMKLRKLTNYAEPLSDFWGRVPGGNRSIVYPSTVAYLARLILFRYAMLGILDPEGRSLAEMGVMVRERPEYSSQQRLKLRNHRAGGTR